MKIYRKWISEWRENFDEEIKLKMLQQKIKQQRRSKKEKEIQIWQEK
jgi:3-phenylpropionate/cinnamic acid dioxygenase small subunit